MSCDFSGSLCLDFIICFIRVQRTCLNSDSAKDATSSWVRRTLPFISSAKPPSCVVISTPRWRTDSSVCSRFASNFCSLNSITFRKCSGCSITLKYEWILRYSYHVISNRWLDTYLAFNCMSSSASSAYFIKKSSLLCNWSTRNASFP